MKTVKAVYFSATGTTGKVVRRIAFLLAQKMELAYEEVDFTLPAARLHPLSFAQGDVVVLGTPVYAGRVPNVLLKYLETMQGKFSCGVPVVVYGNRAYDDALIELRDLMEKAGIRTVGAAAFVGEHSFSHVLAAHRPDGQDMEKADAFAAQMARKMASFATEGLPEAPIEVKGVPFPYRGYYQPRDRNGESVDIRKVKPLVNERCTGCKRCVEICPMGSIVGRNVREYSGICIKCGACIKNCPENARYYEDAGYLYHRHELEEVYTRRAEPECFL